MTRTTADLPEEDERIVRAAATKTCDCGGEIELESNHERDSSNDRHVCPRCGWSFSERATWRLEDAIRATENAAEEAEETES